MKNKIILLGILTAAIVFVSCNEEGDPCGFDYVFSDYLSESIASHSYENQLEYVMYENGEIIEDGAAFLHFVLLDSSHPGYETEIDLNFYGGQLSYKQGNYYHKTVFFFDLKNVKLSGVAGEVKLYADKTGHYQDEADLIGKKNKEAKIKLEGTVTNSYYQYRTRCSPAPIDYFVDLTISITDEEGEKTYRIKIDDHKR